MPHHRFKTSQVELSRLIQNGIAFALSVAIATWIGLTLERSTGIALIWPPTGIILAILLVVTVLGGISIFVAMTEILRK